MVSYKEIDPRLTTVLFWFQGSEEVNNYFRPQELVFAVDDVISQGIKETIQKYEETVSPLTKLIVSYLDISTLTLEPSNPL